MLPVIGWRLWYGDGTIVSSDQSSWDAAPDQNVQVLEWLHEPPYRTLCYGEDEYRLTPDATPKFGRWMELSAFEQLVDRVVNYG